MKNISENITYKEAIKSWTAIKNGIDNIPNESQLANMRIIAEKIFEPLRAGLGNKPIVISIFFRCLQLNYEVGGAKNSQHMAGNGAAIDLDADGSEYHTNKMIFDYIFNCLEFDQLIWEFGTDENPSWVHVSYHEGHNRNEALVSCKDENNDTEYLKYVP